MDNSKDSDCDNQDQVDVPSIVDSLTDDYINSFKPVFNRYYDTRYYTKFTTADRNLDTCIRMHSNKVSVIYLSPKHSIIERGERIKNVNFQVSNKVNRLQNLVRGKSKRGAQIISPESILCFVETHDNNIYPIYAGLWGRLLEVNSEIKDNPNLIMDDLLSEGFIGIIMQDLHKYQVNMDQLVTENDYK